MQALVEYIGEHGLRRAVRRNVSPQPVPSVTLGVVNRRQGGVGLSSATTSDKGLFLRLAHAVARDPNLKGKPPDFYTSICINAHFGAALHVDRYNQGTSHVVAGGEYSGGELFVAGGGPARMSSMFDVRSPSGDIAAGEEAKGVDHDVRGAWCCIDPATPHGVQPYNGTRVSLVFFSIDTQKVGAENSALLQALGFPLAPLLQPRYRLEWELPYRVFICTSRRCEGVQRDTLRLLQRENVPPTAVTLCVRDSDDALAYSYLGINLLVGGEGLGLPGQRALCLHGRPWGSWNLFLDDDVTSLLRLPEETSFTLHDIVMRGFITTCREQKHLWGLNTSCNGRALNNTVSRKLGLVNGFVFGLVHARGLPQLSISNGIGGAAEDIERSVRFFAHSGLLRFNSIAAVARTWTNPGGLQASYGSRAAREAAHDFCVLMLEAEFPHLLRQRLDLPNRMRFARMASAPREASSGPSDDGSPSSAQSDALPTTPGCLDEPRGGRQDATVSALPPRRPTRHQCSHCSKAYRLKNDLVYHLARVHAEGHVPDFPCQHCGRLFRQNKDRLLHEKARRCASRSGRWQPRYAPVTA